MARYRQNSRATHSRLVAAALICTLCASPAMAIPKVPKAPKVPKISAPKISAPKIDAPKISPGKMPSAPAPGKMSAPKAPGPGKAPAAPAPGKGPSVGAPPGKAPDGPGKAPAAAPPPAKAAGPGKAPGGPGKTPDGPGKAPDMPGGTKAADGLDAPPSFGKAATPDDMPTRQLDDALAEVGEKPGFLKGQKKFIAGGLALAAIGIAPPLIVQKVYADKEENDAEERKKRLEELDSDDDRFNDRKLDETLSYSKRPNHLKHGGELIETAAMSMSSSNSFDAVGLSPPAFTQKVSND